MWRTNGLRAPGPTSMTTPWWIFSVALSGSTIEPTCLVVFCSAWRENTHTEPVMRRRKLKEEEKSVRGQTKVADEDTVAEGLQGLDEAHHRAVARGSGVHREGHPVQVLTRRRREPRKRGQKRDSHSVTLSFRGCTALPHFLHITQAKDRLCHTEEGVWDHTWRARARPARPSWRSCVPRSLRSRSTARPAAASHSATTSAMPSRPSSHAVSLPAGPQQCHQKQQQQQQRRQAASTSAAPSAQARPPSCATSSLPSAPLPHQQQQHQHQQQPLLQPALENVLPSACALPSLKTMNRATPTT